MSAHGAHAFGHVTVVEEPHLTYVPHGWVAVPDEPGVGVTTVSHHDPALEKTAWLVAAAFAIGLAARWLKGRR